MDSCTRQHARGVKMVLLPRQGLAVERIRSMHLAHSLGYWPCEIPTHTSSCDHPLYSYW